MASGRSIPTARIGVVGMAVMGSNLARNLARHGHPVAVYNRTRTKTDAMLDALAEHLDRRLPGLPADRRRGQLPPRVVDA